MGFLFMLIWIIGEYIGKIYDEVKNRPVFVIKDKGNFKKKASTEIEAKNILQ